MQRRILHRFRTGGVIAYPTESCFGLGCDPRRLQALRRVLEIKGRPVHKGLILIAADFSQLTPFIQPVSAAEQAWLGQHWPGPYTFLLPASQRAHPWLRGRHNKIAVRVTNHPGAAGLCRLLGSAVVSTSANRSRKISLKSAAACKILFGSKVLVLSGRTGKQRKPSTIIDFETNKILRG